MSPMSNENAFLFHALLMGIFITFLYDLLRIFRRVVPHRDFFVSAEDLFFWIYCGGEVFLLMYHESDGTLRWFAVFGALAGMFLYKRLVSPILVEYVSLALIKLLGILKKILSWLSRPFRFLFKKTFDTAGRAGHRAGRMAARGKRRLKNRLTYFVKVLKMTIKA